MTLRALIPVLGKIFAMNLITLVIVSADPGARQNDCYELDNFRHCEGAIATAAISRS